jgi:hypothetical protein
MKQLNQYLRGLGHETKTGGVNQLSKPPENKGKLIHQNLWVASLSKLVERTLLTRQY